MIIGILAFANILMSGLNLVPAYPMVGGRLILAWYARRMPTLEAALKACDIGKIFLISMAIAGVILLAIGIFKIYFSFLYFVIILFIYIAVMEERERWEKNSGM